MSQIESKVSQIRTLLGEHKLEQARVLTQRLAQAHPRDPRVATLAAMVMTQCNLPAQALHYATLAARLLPDHPQPRVDLGRLHSIAGDHAKAEAAYREALSLAPHDHAARAALGSLLFDRGRFHEALELCMREGALDPGLAGIAAGCYLRLVRPADASHALEMLLTQFPDDINAIIGAALVLNYRDDAAPADVFAAHRRVGEWFARRHPPQPVPYHPAPGPGQPVRVGILSPDLRQHSVAHFIEPLLRHHDPAAIRLTVYYTNRIEDHVTRRLKPLADAWRPADTLDDNHLAQAIYNDRTDVLVELSGLTHGHCLPVMQMRPAPIGATYIGYPNTTGLSSIAVRLVDSITDPPGAADTLATERLVRLDPCFLCYAPPSDAPEPAPRPEGSPLVLASFNAAQKISATTIRLWTRAVRAVPGCVLMLKSVNFEDAALRDDIRARFVAAGIEDHRILILPPREGVSGHLAAYHEVDIALDPTPYNGTTTTCEALWMGVPVVTLAGGVHAARVGSSLLSAAGLADLVTPDEDSFVRAVSALASDVERRRMLRGSLRGMVRTSPLCDGPAFARRFEAAMRSLTATAR
ncbi:MAG: tetratricopeptide repeat protein [Leptolyngbya sp. PLA1]|nr:tetratricopeptide repeat protein [Leptolyngbya sp. PLA1]